ncbi:GNAT family N-acetyltransferase [Jiella avicenniae]|uniref:GNAT family N-acetyltransferase n=1 Tax=Jiella avicenniae TaxID=2907202 RepID=A0A9X1T5F8_9HYPH|nr:GNAT family N-acetyltransferase [Jiella avicenniae]MCE7028854.1 GNAT family N-acetyltransferase [Jiella avicenniae]
MPGLQIFPFTADHLEAAVALSRREGWPHRPQDWALIAELSHGIVATEGGRVVGTAFCTPFGDGVAMLDMIIVDETMRGRGLGRRLVETVMQAAGERSLRLTATKAGLPLYAKLGFVEAGRILQHQGEVAAVPPPDGVEDAGPADREAIVALDRQAFGADRGALFGHLLAEGEAVVVRNDGRVAGFAVRRPFGRGEVVGPVVAQDEETARRLIAAHFARRQGAFLRVDTPAEHGLGLWLAAQGLAPAGGGVAMTRGAPRSTERSTARTYALTSQALG